MARVTGVDVHLKHLKSLTTPQTRAAVGAAIYAAADIIRTEAALSIVHGAVQGKGHIPSRPGEPPNRDTGQLDTSIVTAKTGELKAEVSANTPYAVALEFGTSKMAERPYMRPATEKHRQAAAELVQKAVNRAAKG
jgi:HK97 gp10 family phage protein